MLKTACSITGENYSLLATETPASKKKVIALSIAMLVPTLIWVFCGFMLAFTVLKAGLFWSIVTALVCGVIVFFIEKLIVMSNGNGWLAAFRIGIGFIVAILGSIAIDEVVFKNDIDINVAHIKNESINQAKINAGNQFEIENDYSGLDNTIKAAQIKFNNAEKAVIDEADGTYGTGKRGVGQITALKNQKAAIYKIELEKLNSKKAQLDLGKASAIAKAGVDRSNSFNEHALLTRIKALFRLVVQDGYMLTTYILFTLLLFFFEFLVVILKTTWKKTNYERKIEMIEEIGLRRMEFLMAKESPIMDPGNYLPQFQHTRELITRKNSLYN